MEQEEFNGNDYPVWNSHNCIDDYVDPADSFIHENRADEWLPCPRCGLEPKVWTFDNGRSTACGCHESKYDHFSVRAESIMSVHTRNGGNVSEYDSDQLRKEWNKYCRGEEYMTHDKLIEQDKW